MPALHAKKRLGQNFLISENIISKIINSIAPNENETIVEIGPGRGALTIPLSESGAKVIAVEFDRDLVKYLKKIMGSLENVSIVQQDFLKFNPAEHDLKIFKLCGNLPFNISSPVIEWTVNNRSYVSKAILMLQKEVALRLSSKPGSKQWSPLAIFTQLYFEINLLFDVSPQHFRPRPEVSSSVVELIPKAAVEVENYEAFEQVVRSSFRQRRKQLINNLAPGIIKSSIDAEKIFERLGLKRNVRAEEVETEKFLELTQELVRHNLVKA